MMHLLTILITAIFLENFVLNQILGICPFIGVSNKMDSAIGMGLAVTFVMLLAGVSTWCVNQYLLIPLQLEYLQTIAFILIIASLVQFIEMVIKKTAPSLYQALGVFLPLITTNSESNEEYHHSGGLCHTALSPDGEFPQASAESRGEDDIGSYA